LREYIPIVVNEVLFQLENQNTPSVEGVFEALIDNYQAVIDIL
jgi:hypothetical protein